jgi:pantothenate kinase type III
MGAGVPNPAQESFDRTCDLLNELLSLAHPRGDLNRVKGDEVRIVALLSRVEEVAIEAAHVPRESPRNNPVPVEEHPDAAVFWGRIPLRQQEGRDRIEAGVEAIHRSAHVVVGEQERCLG